MKRAEFEHAIRAAVVAERPRKRLSEVADLPSAVQSAVAARIGR